MFRFTFSFQNVERAFALLLQRFPRLLKLNQRTLSKKIKVVMAACILHNICILENDNIEYYLDRAQRVIFQQFLNPSLRVFLHVILIEAHLFRINTVLWINATDL